MARSIDGAGTRTSGHISPDPQHESHVCIRIGIVLPRGPDLDVGECARIRTLKIVGYDIGQSGIDIEAVGVRVLYPLRGWWRRRWNRSARGQREGQVEAFVLARGAWIVERLPISRRSDAVSE